MDVRDSLLLVDLDKGGEQLGPLFEEPRRRLQEDAKFRAAWTQYQGLRALAWEAAPELDERLVRQGLQASRRQEVERRLARATGSQDAARELLLKPGGKRSGLPAWAAFLLLIGALGLGWLAFGPAPSTPIPANSFPVSTPVANADAMAFEFPVQTPPRDAALDLGSPPASDETRAENADAREARRLVRENLQAAAQGPAPAAVVTPRPKPTHKAVAHAAPTKPVPKATATSLPTATPAPSPSAEAVAASSGSAPSAAAPAKAAVVVAPSSAPATAVATEGPAIVSFTPEPSPAPTAAQPKAGGPRRLEGAASEASLYVSAAQFPAYAVLNLPATGTVDLRLFDMRGRLVQRYGDGELGAGRWRYDLPAVDEQGQALPKGSYYLRVITHWFSKVEALEQP